MSFRRSLAVVAFVLGILWIVEPSPSRTGTHGLDGFRWDFHPRVYAQGINQGGIAFRGTQGMNFSPTGTPDLRSPVFIGPVYFAESEGGADAELRVGNQSAAAEIHAEYGTSTTYAGVGAFNDRGQSAGVTLSGVAMNAFGSSYATSHWGRTGADASIFQNFGANNSGLIIGSVTSGDPLWGGITNQDGSQDQRYYYRGSYKTLSDNTLTSFQRVTTPVGFIFAGRFEWMVVALQSGVGTQIRSGTAWFSCFNRVSDTETCVISNAVNLPNLESGTLAVTFSMSTSGTNTVEFEVTSDSSLTPTVTVIQVAFFPISSTGTWTDL